MNTNNFYDNLIDLVYKQLTFLRDVQNPANFFATTEKMLDCVQQIAVLNNDKRNHSTTKKWKKANK